MGNRGKKEENCTLREHMKKSSSSLVIREIKVKITMRRDKPFLTHQVGKKQKVSQAQMFMGWQRNKNSHALPAAQSLGRKLGDLQQGWAFACPSYKQLHPVSAHRENRSYNKRLFLVLTDATHRREVAKPGVLPWVHPQAPRVLKQPMPSAHAFVCSSLGRVCTPHLGTLSQHLQAASWKYRPLSLTMRARVQKK